MDLNQQGKHLSWNRYSLNAVNPILLFGIGAHQRVTVGKHTAGPKLWNLVLKNLENEWKPISWFIIVNLRQTYYVHICFMWVGWLNGLIQHSTKYCKPGLATNYWRHAPSRTCHNHVYFVEFGLKVEELHSEKISTEPT